VGRENNENLPPFKVKIKLFRKGYARGDFSGILMAHAIEMFSGTLFKTNFAARAARKS
jgi:hypothetical protein